MIKNTTCRNLNELNKAVKKVGSGSRVMFSGYTDILGEKRRYYYIINENGCTIGDFFGICFNADHEEIATDENMQLFM